MDEDLAEMAALRGTKRFLNHLNQYGDRSAYKAKRELKEVAMEKKIQKELERRRKAEEEQLKSDEEDEDGFRPPPKRKTADDDDDGPFMKPSKSKKNAKKSSKKASNVEKKDSAEDEAMRAFFPMAFGTSKKAVSEKGANKVDNSLLAGKKRGLTIEGPSKAKKSKKADQNEEGKNAYDGADEEEDEDEDHQDEDEESSIGGMDIVEKYKLPVTHEAKLERHNKPISAIAVDNSGARVITGSLDYMVKFWDFGGMDQHMRSFREAEPEENHPIVALSYSPSGSHYLCCTGSSRPKVFDRDGYEQGQMVRGDMYLHDMKYTKGHVTVVTDGHWHPRDKERILTSGQEGTVRIWDTEQLTQNIGILKLKISSHRRVPVTACCWSKDGTLIAGAGMDGSLQVWKHKANGKYIRPDMHFKTAHVPETETACVQFSDDGKHLISRGGDGDDTLKLWDLRKTTKPVKVWENLCNKSRTSCLFSPDQKLIMTATKWNSPESLIKREPAKARLMVYDRQTLELVQPVEVCRESEITKFIWHPTLNQVFTACSDGVTRILFSPKRSKKGALLCVGKRARKKDAAEMIEHFEIRTPNALPMFKDVNPAKRRHDINQGKLALKPDEPLSVSKGGRAVNTSQIAHYIQKQILNRKITSRHQDPREELLKYADKATADPMFFGRAYAKTQPKPIYAEDTGEVDDEIARISANKREHFKTHKQM